MPHAADIAMLKVPAYTGAANGGPVEKYRRPTVHKKTAGRRCLLGANAVTQAYIRAA